MVAVFVGDRTAGRAPIGVAKEAKPKPIYLGKGHMEYSASDGASFAAWALWDLAFTASSLRQRVDSTDCGAKEGGHLPDCGEHANMPAQSRVEPMATCPALKQNSGGEQADQCNTPKGANLLPPRKRRTTTNTKRGKRSRCPIMDVTPCKASRGSRCAPCPNDEQVTEGHGGAKAMRTPHRRLGARR